VRTQAVGGMLFRCEGCPLAFCEDHLPPEADVVMESQRYNDLGMRRIAAACYVRCSPECLRLAEALAGEGGAAGKSPKEAGEKSPKVTAAAAKSHKAAAAGAAVALVAQSGGQASEVPGSGAQQALMAPPPLYLRAHTAPLHTFSATTLPVLSLQ
jgi:hypothetical protein